MAAPASEPRVRVAAVILIDGHILMVRQSRDGAEYHLLPGGGVEPGETIGAALTREVVEETGLEVSVDRPLFISDTIAPDGSRHLVNLTFLARITGGGLAASSDPAIHGLDLISAADISAVDLRPPLAEPLSRAWSAGFNVPAAYLGQLWTGDAA